MIKGISESTNEVKQELFLIRNKQAELSTSVVAPPVSTGKNQSSSNVKPSTRARSNQAGSYSSKGGSDLTDPVTTPLSSAQLPSTPGISSSTPSSASRSMKPRKTLLVGDSISANIDIQHLENATQSKFTSVRAYSSVHDAKSNPAKQAARFPNSNFRDVVPAALEKDNYETLILQAGSVDITNINTKDNQSKYMEYYRQETVMSAKRLFQTAVSALCGSSNLKKVVIMKQTPRYDPLSVDPLSLKPALSQLYNNTITEEWMTCEFKDNIYIGSHNNIDCTGAIREARYRETKSGKFDGLHFWGASGRKIYTLSVLDILRSANVTSSDYDYHQSCAQYQARQHYGGQNIYTQVRNTGKNVYRQSMNNKHNCDNVPNQQPIHFSIPTKKRFEQFSKNC